MKKILIIGAGFLQDFVIRKAVSMGYETLAVDADPDAIGFRHASKYAVINIVDENACLDYARKEKIDGVLTAATDYGVLTAAYIAQEMGLPGLKYEVAQLIKNKYKVRKQLFEKQVDDSEQAYIIDENTDVIKLAPELVYPVMVKPCDGSGSRGASRVDNAEKLEEACRYAMAGSISRRAEIETFISGQEYGAESLVIDGKVHVMAIMKKWMTNPPYYAELGHAIPSGLPCGLEDKARLYVEKAIRTLGINHGAVNMDMIITEDNKIYIVDIGARMGGNLIGSHIIPYGTGIDYMGSLIRITAGDQADIRPDVHQAVATRLLAFREGIIKKMPNMQAVEKQYDVEIYHHITEGMLVNNYRTNLDGCGYIVAKAENMEKAVQKAEQAKSEIECICFGS